MACSDLENERTPSSCQGVLAPVTDALYVLNGKWKLPILIALRFGNKRFGQLAREIPGINERMLSKELRALELNQLVKRSVFDTIPVTVEYALTDYGFSLDKVIDELKIWGKAHRERLVAAETA